jgi:hypothetical protein
MNRPPVGAFSAGTVFAIEECLALDPNWLYRYGCLEPGWTGPIQWNRDGKPFATINFRAESFRHALSYGLSFPPTPTDLYFPVPAG